MISITARFDLELVQYDIINAFIHILLLYNVFIKMLPGYIVWGKMLRLKKALYRLRETPLL